MKHKLSNKNISLIISLIYVGLGTIYGLTYWTPANPANGFGDFLFNFFAPVSFLMIGILFAERDPFFFVLITQTITFFIVWGLAYGIICIFRTDNPISATNDVDN
jgi:hypothetical protein